MRNRFTTALVGLVSLVTFGALTATPAAAITGGEFDATNRYANVGIIVFYDADGRFRCSATLMSPTVLVTAAHCTKGTVGKTIVSFDNFIDDAAPSDIPRAGDDPGDGSSDTGYTTAPAGWHAGTAHFHPEYSDFTDIRNWNDVGVVVLDEPVAGISPAPLAPLNYLQRFAQPALNSTVFTSVGYGTEVRKPDSGPQKPTPQSFPIMRRFTDVIGQKLTPQILQTNGNEHDTRAGGGTCFGDSGGPTIKNDYVVTVTSYGYTLNCRYLDGLQRIDIAVVQSWLATFGVHPAA